MGLMVLSQMHRLRPPHISLIVPVHNSAATLRVCLEHAFSSSFSDFEVIIVDDCSSDSSAQIAGSFPCKVISLTKNVGAGVARNIGVKRSSGEILYFLDSDTVMMPDALAHTAKTFQDHPEYAAAFGSFEKESIPDNFVSAFKNLRHHYTHQTSGEEASSFCAGFGAVRREAFLRVGGFDARWRYMEDVDLGYRLHRAGYRIFLDKDLRSIHLKGYSLVSLIRSDLRDRAIPWTRLMLEQRIFQNDLNTKTNNVASVPLSFALLAALAWPRLWPLAPVLALLLLFLNRDFLGFLNHERGFWFAAKSAAMCWLGYLYSGVGAVAGVFAYAWDQVRGRRPQSAAAAGVATGGLDVPEDESLLVKSAEAGTNA